MQPRGSCTRSCRSWGTLTSAGQQRKPAQHSALPGCEAHAGALSSTLACWQHIQPVWPRLACAGYALLCRLWLHRAWRDAADSRAHCAAHMSQWDATCTANTTRSWNLCNYAKTMLCCPCPLLNPAGMCCRCLAHWATATPSTSSTETSSQRTCW
jgi:hypothetical protein